MRVGHGRLVGAMAWVGALACALGDGGAARADEGGAATRAAEEAPVRADEAPAATGAAEAVRAEPVAAPPPPPARLLADSPYAGVTLGGAALPPSPPPAAGPQKLTWLGYQERAGVPTVFFQLTGVPRYRVEERGAALVVTLDGVSPHLRNTLRPLELGAFGGPALRVAPRRRGAGVEVEIRLRAAGAAHRERVEASSGGYQLLVVELPR